MRCISYFPYFFSSFAFAVAASTAAAQAPIAPITPSARPFFNVSTPTPAQMAQWCAGTDDLRECGMKVEAQQLPKAKEFIERRGNVISIRLADGARVHFLNQGGAEAGETYAFFGYHAGAEAVTLYHAKANRLSFMVVSRLSGNGTTIPNEPVFAANGERFITADVCKAECEQRITVWRMDASAVRRQAEFIVPATVVDAAAAWAPNGKIWIELTHFDARKQSLELALDDQRWIQAGETR